MPKYDWAAWRTQWTPLLAYACFCLLVGDMLFGYDTGSFGGILGNQGFINAFGEKNAKGVYVMPTLRTSLLSSLAFIGKFVGCFIAGPAIERIGHRYVFFALSIISCIGIILELTAAGTANGSGRYEQFIVGRIIVYMSVGLVEVTVTTYQSEIVPPMLRGLVVVSLQLFLNSGSLLATGINKALSHHVDSTGWRIVTGIQFVYPVLIFCFVWMLPDSPRWLISKDRDAEAVASLRKLRNAQHVAAGHCELEVAAIRQALHADVHKQSWLSLFRGTNLRRTMIVLWLYTFQQCTGQAFVSTYQVVFYKSNGYAAQAYTFAVVTGALGLCTVIPCMFMIDSVGRRPLLMISYSLQGLFMFLLAGMGSLKHPTATQKNAVVAFFMLYTCSYNFGGASIPYITGAEIPSFNVREKTDALGTALNVAWAFATNFSIPYLLADLHTKVGYIFGSISLAALVYTFIFVPETKNLALEEVDSLFDAPFNPFRRRPVVINEAARRVGQLEGEQPQDKTEVVDEEEKARYHIEAV